MQQQWGPQEAGGIVGNIEGEMVAWCTKAEKYGARQIPAGALQGVTFVKTPHYVQGETLGSGGKPRTFLGGS